MTHLRLFRGAAGHQCAKAARDLGAPHVDPDGHQDDQAEDHVLNGRRRGIQVEAVLHDDDRQCPDERREDVAAPTGQARPTDDRRCDRLQFERLPIVRRAGIQPRRHQDGTHGRHQPGDGEGECLDAPDIDPRQLGRSRIAPDGVDFTAEPCVVHHHGCRAIEEHQVVEGQRHPEKAAVEDRLEMGIEGEDRRAPVEHQRETAIGDQTRQSDDERGNAQERGQHAIDRPQKGAKSQHQHEGEPQRHAHPLEQRREDHGQQRHHRARAEIDAAGEDHHRRADRHQWDDRNLKGEIGQVAGIEEPIRRQRDDQGYQ